MWLVANRLNLEALVQPPEMRHDSIMLNFRLKLKLVATHELCVRENSIGDDDAQAIAGILSKCDSLQSLDVAQIALKPSKFVTVHAAPFEPS